MMPDVLIMAGVVVVGVAVSWLFIRPRHRRCQYCNGTMAVIAQPFRGQPAPGQGVRHQPLYYCSNCGWNTDDPTPAPVQHATAPASRPGARVNSVRFCSEAEAVRLESRRNYALISITNPRDVAPLREGWETILRISFADASYDAATIQSFGRSWKASSLGFPTKAHAHTIRRFLGDLPAHIDTLVVHCGAGVSRSGAVAKYAAGRYGLPFPEEYRQYNDAVYRLLVEPDVFDAALAKCRAGGR